MRRREFITLILQLLKMAIPGLSRVALLVNPSTQVARLYTDVTQAAAAKLDLTNHTFECSDARRTGTSI
jgi:hypothetical protein